LCAPLKNLSRSDLTPMEEAKNYQELIDVYSMTLEQVGNKFGKTAGTIKRRMDLLKMPPALQKAVHKGLISMSAAEELWPISNETDLDYYLLFAVENGCTKEVARQWCKQWKDSQRHQSEPGVETGGRQVLMNRALIIFLVISVMAPRKWKRWSG